jgi:predicted enzyme related to lactoylglutathione lyase
VRVLEVLIRVFVSPEHLEDTISFYERLFGKKARLRFSYPEAELELAGVGSMLLIAGSEEALRPFRNTKATFMVDSVKEAWRELQGLGATILEEPKQVPTWWNMRVEHPDGMIVEYVQHASRDESSGASWKAEA